MAERLTLAYSPCPNDTYIFAALANGLLPDAPAVRVQLEDVENLNNSALKADYELTKVSYGAIPLLMQNYSILRAGGALGTGCGPLVVARPGTISSLDDLHDKLVAIPGEMTTAFMLLRLALNARPQTVSMRFDLVMDAVIGGTADAGLIIHESRFTYADRGLERVADLCDWWEEQTSLPIPLGAILIRSDVAEQASEINDALRRSLSYAREHEDQVMPYVRQHATEMSEPVMRRHIETYVNEYSVDVGDLGIAAARELFRRAHEARVVPETAEPVFV
ncbi:MAG TPA: 1,4-dihydroxy-6-naphthoate synthase [Candidatus Baltobacteraceae bacterium]|nr:1,4-dihydroxy-6-naphthoate synthase [Candidatus Baltobacteraceae bacterium]